MPEKAAPLYQWLVTFRDTPPGFPAQQAVEAAYSVIEDGHMVLKGADHSPVFTAEPGLGCTFTRAGAAGQGAADHWTVEPAPGGRCRMVHDATGKASEGATEDEAFGRLARELLRAGDIAITPGRAVPPAAKDPAPRCPHGVPSTVRCHECSPVGP